MNRLILIILFLFTTSFSISQKQQQYRKQKATNETIVYQDWTVATGGNCGNVTYKCAGFNYGVLRTKNKVYDPNTGQYYYYYYLYFVSNSTYQGGGWAYTALYDVNFYMDGQLVLNEPYILFKEKSNVCIMWHGTNPNAQITFTWKNVIVY